MADRSRRRALSLYSFESVVKQYEELWDELGHIALGLKLDRGAVDYDRLRYYKLFGNYASAALTDETTVKLTQLGKQLASNELSLPDSLPHLDFKLLDQAIIRQILKLMNNAQSGTEASEQGRGDDACIKPIGELIRRLALETSYNVHYLRRHLMWLVKYSYVHPVEGYTTLQPAEPPACEALSRVDDV